MARYGIAFAAASITIIAGCASVSKDPAVPAFASGISAANLSFQTARSAEADAFAQQALGVALQSGSVRSEHCLIIEEAKDCAVAIIINGQRVDLSLQGPILAKDAAALAAYADKMKALAAATDLATRKTALAGLATTAGAVFAAAGVPGVAAVGQLLVDLENKVELNQRRHELALIAEKVDPAVQKLSVVLQQVTPVLQANVVLARSQIVSNLQAQLAASKPGDLNRVAVAHQLIAAAEAEQSAAALQFDLTAIGRAHRAMITSLTSSKPESLSDTIAEVQVVVSDAEAIKSAFMPKGTAS